MAIWRNSRGTVIPRFSLSMCTPKEGYRLSITDPHPPHERRVVRAVRVRQDLVVSRPATGQAQEEMVQPVARQEEGQIPGDAVRVDAERGIPDPQGIERPGSAAAEPGV